MLNNLGHCCPGTFHNLKLKMEVKWLIDRDLCGPAQSSESLEPPWLCHGIRLAWSLRWSPFDRCGISGCCRDRWVLLSTHGCPSVSGGQRLLPWCRSSGFWHSNLFYWSIGVALIIGLFCKSAAHHAVRCTGLWIWQLWCLPFVSIVGLEMRWIYAYLSSSESFLGG